MDWFLYDKDLRHERVNALFPKMVKHFENQMTNVNRWDLLKSYLQKVSFIELS